MPASSSPSPARTRLDVRAATGTLGAMTYRFLAECAEIRMVLLHFLNYGSLCQLCLPNPHRSKAKRNSNNGSEGEQMGALVLLLFFDGHSIWEELIARFIIQLLLMLLL